MHKFIKLFHFIGLTMFLGSIVCFIVISTVAEASSLQDLVFARELISAGIASVTQPGLWLIVITGVLMSLRGYGFFKLKWLTFKQTVIILIVVNAYAVVIPAADDALAAAQISLEQGSLVEEYTAAYVKESIFGGINILLIVLSMIAGIWKFKTTASAPKEQHTS